MAWSDIPPYAPTELIASQWANTLFQNEVHLDNRTGHDAAAPNLFLVSGPTPSLVNGWRALQSGDFSNGLIPDAAMAHPKVNLMGDTMQGDLTVSRQGSGQPTVGYILLGQTGSIVYLGYDGTNIVVQGARVLIPGILQTNSVLQAPGAAIGTSGVSLSSGGSIAVGGGGGISVSGTGGVGITGSGGVSVGGAATLNVTSQIRVLRTQGASGPAFDAAPLVVQSPSAAANPAETAGIGMHRTLVSGIYLHHAGAAATNWLRFITNDGTPATVFHSLNMGAGSTLDADTVRTRIPGAGSGNLAILDAAGKVALAVAADSAANATQVGGRTPNATAGAGRIPIADAAGKLDAWITAAVAGATVPSGAIVAFNALASLTAAGSGWTRHNAADGRLLVGDGTTFGQAFSQAGSYGASWDHGHSTPAHQHSGDPLTIAGSTGPASGSGNQANVVTPNPASAIQGHTHDQGSLDVGGSTANDGSSTSGSTTWMPPMLAVVWGRKL